MFENDVSPGCNIVVSIYKNELLKEQRERKRKKSRMYFTLNANPFVKKHHIVFCGTFIKSPQIYTGELIFIR